MWCVGVSNAEQHALADVGALVCTEKNLHRDWGSVKRSADEREVEPGWLSSNKYPGLTRRHFFVLASSMNSCVHGMVHVFPICKTSPAMDGCVCVCDCNARLQCNSNWYTRILLSTDPKYACKTRKLRLQVLDNTTRFYLAPSCEASEIVGETLHNHSSSPPSEVSRLS